MTSTNSKQTVLFVGAHQRPSDSGHVGGQMFACNSLVDSRLSEEVDWILLDTTASTNKKRSFSSRLANANKRFSSFKKIIRERDVDWVLIFTSSGFSFVEKGMMILHAKRKGVKAVLAPRSGYLKGEIQNKAWMRTFAKRVMSKADYIIMQGSSWQSFYGKNLKIGSSKLKVINNWINSEPYSGGNPQQSNQPLRAVFLGWVEPNKGIHDLLHVIADLKTTEVLWQIAGDGKSFEAMKTLAHELGIENQVKFLGWVKGEEKIDLLTSSDFFLLPSYNEGLPNALLEAMASGLACVATRVGAIPDVIEDGVDGILIEAGDRKGLELACQNLIADSKKRIQMGEKAQNKIQKQYSIERASSKFAQLFQTG